MSAIDSNPLLDAEAAQIKEKISNNEPLHERLQKANLKLPEMMSGISSINSKLQEEISQLEKLIDLTRLPDSVKAETTGIIIDITHFRSGCLDLSTAMIPTVKAMITGIKHYDTSSGKKMFNKHIMILLDGENLIRIQKLVGQCRGLLDRLTKYHEDLAKAKHNNEDAARQLQAFSMRMIAMISGAGVTFAITLGLGLTVLSSWPILAAASAVGLAWLGITAWWSYRKVTQVIEKGENAVDKIILRINEYTKLLKSCEDELKKIEENYQNIQNHYDAEDGLVFREEMNGFCHNLLQNLETLRSSCAS